jgi:hypothetical protein
MALLKLILFVWFVQVHMREITTLLDIPSLPPMALQPISPLPPRPPSPPHATLTCYATDFRPVIAGMMGTFYTFTTPGPYTSCIKAHFKTTVVHPQHGVGVMEGVYMNGIDDVRLLTDPTKCVDIVAKALQAVDWSAHYNMSMLTPSFSNITCCQQGDFCNKPGYNQDGFKVTYLSNLIALSGASDTIVNVLTFGFAMLAFVMLNSV